MEESAKVFYPFYTELGFAPAQECVNHIPGQRNFISYAYVPSEVVLDTPTSPTGVFHTARLYSTGLYFYNELVGVNGLVTRKTFWDYQRDKKGSMCLGEVPELHLYEVWQDEGDDGHVRYQLGGYLWALHPYYTSAQLSFRTVQQQVYTAVRNPLAVDYASIIQLMKEK